MYVCMYVCMYVSQQAVSMSVLPAWLIPLCMAHTNPQSAVLASLGEAIILCRRLLSLQPQLCVAGVERVQVVCSMNPATTVGRQPLSPRLAALLHIACMTYPPPAQLQTIVSTLLARTLDKACSYRKL